MVSCGLTQFGSAVASARCHPNSARVRRSHRHWPRPARPSRLFSFRVPDTRAREPDPGDPHAYTPNCDLCRIRYRACRFANPGRPGAILSALFAISAVLAVLCGGCPRRHRRDDRNCAVLGPHGNTTLLLRLLWTALQSVLSAAGASLPAGPQLYTSTDLHPSGGPVRRQHRQTIEPTGAEPLAGTAGQSTTASILSTAAALLKDVRAPAA